jgi:hypothetical protein
MERRNDHRQAADFEVQVTDLGCPGRSASGHVRDISKSGICAMLPLDLSPGSAIRLNIEDSVLFGHVAYSQREGALFRTGIEVAQVLVGGTALSKLLHRALRETIPGTHGLEPSETFLG